MFFSILSLLDVSTLYMHIHTFFYTICTLLYTILYLCTYACTYACTYKYTYLYINSLHTLYTCINIGWKEGTKITFNPTSSYPKYITFIIKQIPHTLYKRIKNDLYTICYITTTDLRDGCIIHLKLLNNTIYNIDTKKENVKGFGTSIVIKGLGMPYSTTSSTSASSSSTSSTSREGAGVGMDKKYGDLIVKFVRK